MLRRLCIAVRAVYCCAGYVLLCGLCIDIGGVGGEQVVRCAGRVLTEVVVRCECCVFYVV